MKYNRVLRPALIASMIGFGWGISMTMRPSGMSYGDGYFVISLVISTIYAVIAFLIVFIWKGILRHLAKPKEKVSPQKTKSGFFTAIISHESALDAIKVAGWLIIGLSGISFTIRIFVGNMGLAALDAILAIGLVVLVFRAKNREAAVGLLLLSLLSAFATGYNRFYGGEGGANLLLALLNFWASIRLVIASFWLHSHRTQKPNNQSSQLEEHTNFPNFRAAFYEAKRYSDEQILELIRNKYPSQKSTPDRELIRLIETKYDHKQRK